VPEEDYKQFYWSKDEQEVNLNIAQENLKNCRKIFEGKINRAPWYVLKSHCKASSELKLNSY
jgi:septal ring-binding cell division protein DamX